MQARFYVDENEVAALIRTGGCALKFGSGRIWLDPGAPGFDWQKEGIERARAVAEERELSERAATLGYDLVPRHDPGRPAAKEDR